METSESAAQSRLKCFLHLGTEERIYVPNGNLKYSFRPDIVASIEELLRDDEQAKKIVPLIMKIHQCETSIEPCILLYALAMVIRKARVNMEKEESAKSRLTEMEVETKVEEESAKTDSTQMEMEKQVKEKPADSGSTQMEVEAKEKEEIADSGLTKMEVEKKSKKKRKKDSGSEAECAPSCSKAAERTEGDTPNPSQTEKKIYKLQTWDEISRDAYKAARKLSKNNAENILMFTYYLREIAKTDGKRGFGRGWRETIDKFYEYQSAIELAESVTRFYDSVMWTHADILAIRRWNGSKDKAKDAILHFVKGNFEKVSAKYEKDNDKHLKTVLRYLKLIHDLRRAKDVEHALEFVTKPEIKFDVVPPVFLNSHTIWLHLLPKMSPQKVLSLINRISRLKLFKHTEIVTKVVSRLEQLDDTRTHPIHVFITCRRYEEGPNLAIEFQYIQRRRQMEESNNVPAPRQNENNADDVRDGNQLQRISIPRRNQELIKCLNNVFNKTISSLATTGKRFLIGYDAQAASASKRCLYERFITIEEAALVVALCVIKAEAKNTVNLVTFTKEACFREIAVNRDEETMDTLKTKISRADCVTGNVGDLIRYATRNKQEWEVFIVLSDNLVQVGGAYEALKTYQNEVKPTAKVITCSFVGRHKKYKDLTKPGMLLICGFDKHVGKIIEAYSRDSF